VAGWRQPLDSRCQVAYWGKREVNRRVPCLKFVRLLQLSSSWRRSNRCRMSIMLIVSYPGAPSTGPAEDTHRQASRPAYSTAHCSRL
jgi:hypothetical protein